MRRLLKETIRTSREIKDFRDHNLHHSLFDNKKENGHIPDPFVLEAETIVDDVMDRLSFLQPVVKRWPFRGSVHMKVGIYSDDQHDLDEFANRLGFRSWKVAVLVYLALKMEDGGINGLAP